MMISGLGHNMRRNAKYPVKEDKVKRTALGGCAVPARMKLNAMRVPSTYLAAQSLYRGVQC